MSIKVATYVPSLSGQLLPKIVARFVELGMGCEFHPRFALDPAADTGLVPLRLRVLSSPVPLYENVDMLCGFEISFKEFRYTSPLAITATTNEKLKGCTKQVVIRMQSTYTCALRGGLYFAALLAEQTDGVVYLPRSDSYLEAKQAIEDVTREIDKYESELPPEDWNVVLFSAWTDK